MPFNLTETNLDTNQNNSSFWNQHVHEPTESEFAQINSELYHWRREVSISIWLFKHVEAELKTQFSQV